MLGMKPFGALGAGGRGGGGLGRRAALYLDFVNGMYTVNRQRRALADIMTIAGGVNGTRVNSAGLIEAATCPRSDYDPVTLAARGVLIEEQRTNLLTYSAAFDNAAWTAVDATVSADAIASPSGATDADRITSTAVFAAASVSRLLTVADDAAVYSLGLFAKAGTLTSARIRAALIFGTPVPSSTDVDLTAGTLNGTGETPVAQGIEEYTSDWWRSWVAVQNNASGNTGMAVQFYPGALNLSATGNEGYWGAEVQAGSFMTSHIPTTGSAVTRTADSLTMTGTDFSSWWNQSEGTIVVKFDCFATDADDNFMFSATDASEVEQVRLLVYAGVVYFQINAGGVNVVNMNLGAIDTGSHTLAVAYKANDFAACLDGGAVVTDTSGAVPTVDRAGFGRYAASNNGHLNGHLQAFAYEPRRLSNSMLQALS